MPHYDEPSKVFGAWWGGWVDEAHDKTGENRHWLREIRDYMIDMHIHHTFWCFNENSSDTGGLVYDNFGKWDDVKYEFIKSALWQTEDGRSISLDHQIPIGKNGISLGEYYGGAPAPTTPTETTAPTDPSAPTTDPTAPIPTFTDPTDEFGAVVYGDVDENGIVDIMDVIAVNKSLLGSQSLSDQGKANADIDHSKSVDTTDALNILKAVVKLVTLPVQS